MTTTVKVQSTTKVTVKPDVVETATLIIKAVGPQGPTGSSAGDMTKAVYDPNTVAGDAFAMDNMVEGTATKILTSTERTKLDGIQAGATVNDNAAEIKSKYESNADTNAFTDAEKTKLGTVATSANNYTHPATHPANMIVETATERFVTDVQIADWDSKADALGPDDNYVTDAEKTVIGNTSGTNTGDQVIPTALSDLTEDATHRVVTDTEKATWNGKQDALVADTDYLTPGTAATTYAPVLGPDDNYVTDAEKTVIGNTSGTNTGDQDLSGKQDNITLTTTGSGAATLIGSTLNIPTPSAGGVTEGDVVALVIALG